MEALPLAAAMFGGLDVSSAVILNFGGNFEQKVVQYNCGQEQPLNVKYVNAAPNYLAFLTVEDRTLVFVTVLSASGAKYAAGEYEWWSKGTEATLTNLTTPEAEPIACTEISETP